MADTLELDTITLHATDEPEYRTPNGTNSDGENAEKIKADAIGNAEKITHVDWENLDIKKIDLAQLDKVVQGAEPTNSIPVVDAVIILGIGKWAKDFLNSSSPIDPKNLPAALASAYDLSNYIAREAVKANLNTSQYDVLSSAISKISAAIIVAMEAPEVIKAIASQDPLAIATEVVGAIGAVAGAALGSYVGAGVGIVVGAIFGSIAGVTAGIGATVIGGYYFQARLKASLKPLLTTLCRI